jgi:hypothetical protein
MYRRRISQSQYEKWVQSENIWVEEVLPNQSTRDRMIELVFQGNQLITAGWMATSVRGYHNHFIVWKNRLDPVRQRPSLVLR